MFFVFLDTTPPIIQLLSHPKAFSNQRTVNIIFYCSNEISCTAQCSLLEGNTTVVIPSLDCSSHRCDTVYVATMLSTVNISPCVHEIVRVHVLTM